MQRSTPTKRPSITSSSTHNPPLRFRSGRACSKSEPCLAPFGKPTRSPLRKRRRSALVRYATSASRNSTRFTGLPAQTHSTYGNSTPSRGCSLPNNAATDASVLDTESSRARGLPRRSCRRRLQGKCGNYPFAQHQSPIGTFLLRCLAAISIELQSRLPGPLAEPSELHREVKCGIRSRCVTAGAGDRNWAGPRPPIPPRSGTRRRANCPGCAHFAPKPARSSVRCRPTRRALGGSGLAVPMGIVKIRRVVRSRSLGDYM
jgi:hypothetical protein